jgi:hypothetical protein
MAGKKYILPMGPFHLKKWFHSKCDLLTDELVDAPLLTWNTVDLLVTAGWCPGSRALSQFPL